MATLYQIQDALVQNAKELTCNITSHEKAHSYGVLCDIQRA